MLFTISSLGTAFAGSFTTFVANRLLGGVGIGLASNLSPLYIAEIAPAAMRGKLVSINQLTIVIGILLAQVINWLIAEPVATGATPEQILASWNGQVGWRWMFGVTAVPAFLFFAAMFFVPESPRWLAKAGDEDRARAILARAGGENYAHVAMAEIRTTLDGDRTTPAGDLRAVLDPRIRPAVVIGVVLAVFQQWCGINVIFNYAEEIFSSAGYGVSDILFNIVITGLVNLVFTFVAIGTVDRVGRKALMLVGSAGLAVIYTLIGLCYATGTQGTHLLLLVVAAIALYSWLAGAGDLGRALGDFPEPGAGRRDGPGRVRPLGGLLHPDVHVPPLESEVRPGGDLRDLRRHLRWGSSSSSAGSPRPGGRRSRRSRPSSSLAPPASKRSSEHETSS